MWTVCSLKKTLEVESIIGTLEIDCSWADGMVGALPVFKNKKDAETYADGKATVMEIKEIPDKPEEQEAPDGSL